MGSIYIGTQSACPLASLFGTWTKVSEGRVLQGSDNSHEAGTEIEAGLPNLKGWVQGAGTGDAYCDGELFTVKEKKANVRNDDASKDNAYDFDASNYNSIYGNSTTVQPPAYVVNIWERTV